jgi:hypothetical protein
MQGEWQRKLEAYREAYPAEAAALERDLAGDLPADWDADLDALHGKFDGPVASRTASGAVLAALSRRVPSMVGGSADLAGSNKAVMPGCGSFQPENRSGRNIHFGVREHAMGGVSNGIAYHGGLIPFAATFLGGCVALAVGGPRGGTTDADARIVRMVTQRFAADDLLRGANVAVSSTRGTVTLRGEVFSEAARQRAIDLATDVPDVARVVAIELRVR